MEAHAVQGPDAEHPVVVDYTGDWPARAASLIATLRDRLGTHAARIEHIGSTAIPSMAAKDVLDLQVTVTSLEDAAREFDPPLGTLGFHRTPYERDHVPAGWPDDGQAWVKRLWARREHPGGDVNLHVRLAGSPNERLVERAGGVFEARHADLKIEDVLGRHARDGRAADVLDPFSPCP